MRLPITKPLLRRALLKLYLRERRIMFRLLAKIDEGNEYLNRPVVLHRYFITAVAYRAAVEQVQVEPDIEGERLHILRLTRRCKQRIAT